MTVAIDRVHPKFGARITGVDLARPLDDRTFKTIFEAFNDYSVLVFPRQALSDAEQIAFSRRFGALEEIHELIELATEPNYVYRHAGTAGDLVMWDNRCTLHRGRPWDGTKYRRVMHRTTVAGAAPTVPYELTA